MQFIFFKGLENVSVCRCVCVHMCVRLCDPPSSAWRISPWECLLCSWAMQTHRWRRAAAACDTQSHRQTGLFLVPWAGNLVRFCPYYFKRGDRNFRSFQLCVWHRSLFSAPGASPRFVVARTDKAHCYSSSGRHAKALQCRDASFHWCSQFINCWENTFTSCMCYIGVKWEAGIRNTISLIQKDHILSVWCYRGR